MRFSQRILAIVAMAILTWVIPFSGWSQGNTEEQDTRARIPAQWGSAVWIGYEPLPDSMLVSPGVPGSGDNLGNKALKCSVVPLFRKEFHVGQKVRKATVMVCGLGQYELYLNGQKVGGHFLAPGWTDYRKTCLYNTYDITSQITKGTNCLAAWVGNGFFNINRERYRKLVIAFGYPMIILKALIEYTDGTSMVVVTDATWKTSPSPLVFSSIYGGEDYDARLEQPGWNTPGFNECLWHNAVPVKGPGGALMPEQDYPLKVMDSIPSVRIVKQDHNKTVYDFGQNASGIIRLRVTGPAGISVTVVPGELLGEDSLVSQRSSGEPYYYRYTLKGTGVEEWSPRFTYYGFRYAQVEFSDTLALDTRPVIHSLTMLHVRNAAPEAGLFECSDTAFNRIFRMIRWAIRSNIASVATDCPHREKLGWLEQSYLMGSSVHFNYDIHGLYSKIVDDMADAQLENGLVPDIAPEYVPFDGGFRDSPEWGSACIQVPWLHYQWYGDAMVLQKAYRMMGRYLAYLSTQANNHILDYGLGDWCDLGPAAPGYAQLTPKAFTATAIYYNDLTIVARIASLLGYNSDARQYDSLAMEVKTAFNRTFYHPGQYAYSTGSQTSFAMPLDFRLVPDQDFNGVLHHFVQDIKDKDYALTAGDIGFHYVVDVLSRNGYSGILWEMNHRSDRPGYLFQLKQGATSLPETWQADRRCSHNHMMLGHLMEWFYTGLGGIQQAPGSVAYRNLIIRPLPVGDISWVKTSYRSVQGEIVSNWTKGKRGFIMEVVIPHGSRAAIHVPFTAGNIIRVNGKQPLTVKGITGEQFHEKEAVFDALPGSYRFVSEPGKEK